MDQRDRVERAKRGDHDAFAELVDLRLARLDAAARLILRDPELARDAVQEALIRAWRDLPGLRDPDRFDGLAPPTDRQRLPRPRPPPSTAGDRGRADPDRLAGRRPTSPARWPTATSWTGRSRASIPGHRAVVALHYLLGMPLPEVAASLGIPLGTAKSRLHYSLAAMRVTMAAEPDPTRAAVPGGQVA